MLQDNLLDLEMLFSNTSIKAEALTETFIFQSTFETEEGRELEPMTSRLRSERYTTGQTQPAIPMLYIAPSL